MKRFLSVLLAVMMVLSSSVSYAAPSIADFVDSVIEAPAFEEDAVETPVEEDSATLSEETTTYVVTINHDLNGYLPTFSEEIAGGTYTLDEIKAMIDPDDVMDSAGYYLADVVDASGATCLAFTENGKYTAVWDRYNVLAGYEFDDAESTISFAYGGNGAATNDFVNGACVSTITAYSYGYRINSTDSWSLGYDVSDVSDIVYRMKNTGTGTVLINNWVLNKKVPSTENYTLTDEYKVYSYKTAIGEETWKGYAENETYSTINNFRLQMVANEGAVIHTDYIRVLGATGDNLIVDMSYAPVAAKDFKVVRTDDTMTAQDILDAADKALAAAGYTGDLSAKYVYYGDTKLEATASLADEYADQSKFTVYFSTNEILSSYEFTSSTGNLAAASDRATTTLENGALKIYNLPDATNNDIFLALSFDYSTEELYDIATRVMYTDTDYNNSMITFDAVHMAGTKIDGTTFGFATSGYTPSGTYYVTDNEWTAFTYKTAISTFESLLETLTNLSGVRFPFSSGDLPDGASVYVDYIRILGNNTAPVAVFEGVVNGETVRVSVPYNADFTLADLVSNTGLNTDAGCIKSVSYGETVLDDETANVSTILADNTDSVNFFTFEYANKIPVELNVDGTTVETSYADGLSTASVLLANSAVTDTGKTAGALRVVGTNTVFDIDDVLTGIEEGAELEVIWSEYDNFGYDFDALLKAGSSNINTSSYATMGSEGENYYLTIGGTTSNRLYLLNLSIPAGKLDKIYFTTNTASISGSMFWDSKSGTQNDKSDGFSMSSVIYSGTLVSGSTTMYEGYINAADLENTSTNYKGSDDMKTTGLTFLRWDLSSGIIFDDIRFVGTDVLPVAILECSEETLYVPYSSTTTVADVLALYNEETRFMTSIANSAGTLEGTTLLSTVLDGSGVLSYTYADKVKVTLDINGTSYNDVYIKGDELVDDILTLATSRVAENTRGILITEANGNMTVLPYGASISGHVSDDATITDVTSEVGTLISYDFENSAESGVTTGSVTASYDNKYLHIVNDSSNDAYITIFAGSGIHTSILRDVVARLTYSNTEYSNTPLTFDYIYYSGTTASGESKALGKISALDGSYTATNNVATEISYATAISNFLSSIKSNLRVLTSIRLSLAGELAANSDDAVDVDYIRITGLLPVAVFDLSEIGLDGVLTIPYDSTTTVTSAIEQLEAQEGFDSDIYTDLSIGGKTDGTLYDILGGEDGLIEIGSSKNVKITLDANRSQMAVDDNVTVTFDSSYFADEDLTVDEFLADKIEDNYYGTNGVWEITGVSTTADGTVVDGSTKLADLTSTTLYAQWKEVNVLTSFEFNSDADYNRLTALGFRNISRTAHSSVANAFTNNTANGYATINIAAHATAQTTAVAKSTFALEADTGINTIVINAAPGVADKIVMKLRYDFPTEIESYTANINGYTVNSNLEPANQTFYAADIRVPAYHYWKGTATSNSAVSGAVTNKYTPATLEAAGWIISVVDSDDFDNSGLYQFRFDTNGLPDGTTIDIDYIRVIGKNDVKYVSINDKFYSYNAFTTVADMITKAGVEATGLVYKNKVYSGDTTLDSIGLDADAALTAFTSKEYTVTNVALANGTFTGTYDTTTTIADVYSAIRAANDSLVNHTFVSLTVEGITYTDTATKLVDILGANGGTFTLTVKNPVTITINNVETPDTAATMTAPAGNQFPANLTVKELMAKFTEISGYTGVYYFEGLSETDGGVVYDESTLLEALEGKTLYVVWDKQNLLFSYEGGELPKSYAAGYYNTDTTDDDLLTLTAKKPLNATDPTASSSNYLDFTNLYLSADDIEDIVFRVNAPSSYSTTYFFVYSSDVKNDNTVSTAFTGTDEFQTVSFMDTVGSSFKFNGSIVKNLRTLQYANLPEGTTLVYDYVRAIGKPLPEVNVDTSAITASLGSVTLTAKELMNVDYTESMTFGDLVDAIGFTPVYPYQMTGFTVTSGENTTPYALSDNMWTALGGTGTTNLTPVVEKIYSKTYTVNFGEQADFFAVDNAVVSLTVENYDKTVADLEALMIDHGNMIFKGFATKEEYDKYLADDEYECTLLSSDTALEPSNETEYENYQDENGETATPTVTYYAIWEDYTDYINSMYSAEFTAAEGYKVGNPGKSSLYSEKALDAEGNYLYIDEDGNVVKEIPNFVNHMTIADDAGNVTNGYIRLKFDASPYAKTDANMKVTIEGEEVQLSETGIWDSNITLATLAGSTNVPRGVMDKIVIRMRYGREGGELPTDSVNYACVESAGGYNTASGAKYYAPFLYYTNEDYTSYTDKQIYTNYIDISDPESIYRGNWFTVTIDASELGLDEKDLYELRLDPTDAMLDGSYLDIDYIRFVETDTNIVDYDAVKSQKDFDETDDLYGKLASSIRANLNDLDADGISKNGVRVMGWLYAYAAQPANDPTVLNGAYTQSAGWMFSASDRFQKAVGTSEDGWMDNLTMDLYNDAEFNTSSLILTGNYIEDGVYKTNAFDKDGENPLFSAVLYNIPVKNYQSNFVVRPYVQYAGKYIYGTPFEMSFYEFSFGASVNEETGEKTYYSGDLNDDGTLEATTDETANGAYFNCDNHDCAICNYLEECYANWLVHVNEKTSFEIHYSTYFASLLASPVALVNNIVVPTGTISDNTNDTVVLEVLNNETGKLETVTVYKSNTWPALVADEKLNSLYTLRPCAIAESETEDVYYIMSLGYGRDSNAGNYSGIEKTYTSVLDGEAETDATNMFIRNRFEPKSPFRQVDRLAQVPETGENRSNSAYSDSFFLGDFGFGDYDFSTTVWSGVTKEFRAGKTAYPVVFDEETDAETKIVVKYNYTDEDGNITSSEWVTYDIAALESITSIDFKNVSYIVSNDVDNKPDDDDDNSTYTYNEVAYKTTCPMEVENLVFLFGEVDMPAISSSSVEFDALEDVYTLSQDNDPSVTDGILTVSANTATSKTYSTRIIMAPNLDASLYNTIRIRGDITLNPTATSTNRNGYIVFTKNGEETEYEYTFNMDTAKGVDADEFGIFTIDLSEAFEWSGTINSATLILPQGQSGTSLVRKLDYIRFLATGYSSDKTNLERVGGLFEDFSKGFTINGFEGAMTSGAFEPTQPYFATSQTALDGYNGFDADADVDKDGDKNYADWTIDPLYTYNYYGIYNDIIKKNSDKYDATVKGNADTYNFSSLYNGDYKQLRWDIMTNSEYTDAFDKYYSEYEFGETEFAYAEDGTLVSATIKDDAGSKEIIYKPNQEYTVGETKKTGDILTMTLNSSKLYSYDKAGDGIAEQYPHVMWSSVLTEEKQTHHFWPHLLIQQSRGSQPVAIAENENGVLEVTNSKYRADADRIFAEFDIRITNYKDYDITNDSMNMSFLLYSYLCPNVSPGTKIWFGIPLADEEKVSSGGMSWGRESGGNTHMANLSEAMVYGSAENSLTQRIINAASGELDTSWIHVELDLTPYIDIAIEMANAEDAFGLGVTTKSDWHFNGVNIGYETAGNVDATIEIANFNFYSYNDTSND